MRLRVAISFLLCLSCLRLPVSGQQSASPPVVRDSQSLAALQQSIAAMGGSAALQNTGIVAHGQITVPPAGISGTILWERQGSEFRYERPGPNGTIVFVSGHGNPALSNGVTVRRNIGHLALTTLPPHLGVVLLSASLANPHVSISASQQASLGASPAIKISLQDTTDELTTAVCKQDWYFDSTTLLAVRVDFLASETSNALSNVKMTYLFSNYLKVSGVQIPLSVTTLADGQQIEQITFSSVIIGGTIPSTDFDAPVIATGSAQ